MTEDPFKIEEGLDYAVQFKREPNEKWGTAMEWVTLQTAVSNCRKMAEEGFMQAIRCVKKSRYPPWPVCSVHYYWEERRR